jgi:hypothetical protein
MDGPSFRVTVTNHRSVQAFEFTIHRGVQAAAHVQAVALTIVYIPRGLQRHELTNLSPCQCHCCFVRDLLHVYTSDYTVDTRAPSLTASTSLLIPDYNHHTANSHPNPNPNPNPPRPSSQAHSKSSHATHPAQSTRKRKRRCRTSSRGSAENAPRSKPVPLDASPLPCSIPLESLSPTTKVTTKTRTRARMVPR